MKLSSESKMRLAVGVPAWVLILALIVLLSVGHRGASDGDTGAISWSWGEREDDAAYADKPVVLSKASFGADEVSALSLEGDRAT